MKIAFITPGGDAPGMNACLRAAVRIAISHNFETYGIYRGYSGLLQEQISRLDKRSVGGIISRGGTILKSSRCEEIKTTRGQKKAADILNKYKFNYLVVIGGDGSFQAANKISGLSKIPVVCIPASIDNDVYGTDESIGFDTAVDTAVAAIDKIRDTATSFDRVFIVEVMGREHGFLATAVALASGAEFVMVPEFNFSIQKICRQLKEHKKAGKTSGIIIFAEGCGDIKDIAEKIEKGSGLYVRISILGYIQRGGDPSARSRILATKFAEHSINLIKKKSLNRVVVFAKCGVSDISLKKSLKGEKKLDSAAIELVSRVA
ncbi:MAG: 6-phosphofructokinase [Elusimicrobiota bacterium]